MEAPGAQTGEEKRTRTGEVKYGGGAGANQVKKTLSQIKRNGVR